MYCRGEFHFMTVVFFSVSVLFDREASCVTLGVGINAIDIPVFTMCIYVFASIISLCDACEG